MMLTKKNYLFLFLPLYIIAVFFLTPQITQAKQEYRIISLAPNLTEILFEIGLDHQLIGVSSFSDYPDKAKKIESVGSYLKPNIEKIIALNPTHVLVMKEGNSDILQSLQRAKIPYFVFQSEQLSDYEEILKKVGNIFSKEQESLKLISAFKNQINLIQSINTPNRKIMIQVDHNPIFVSGNNTFINEALNLCGFQNVFSNINGFKKVSVEQVMNRKPDFILIIGQLNKKTTIDMVKKFWISNPATNHSVVIEGEANELSRLTSRFLPALTKICQHKTN